VTHGEEGEDPWPIGLALATLAGVTVLVALVSEIFVESVQEAAVAFGMTPAFVGRKNRLDLSVGIALGSVSQIALFVAPVRHRPGTDGSAILAGRRGNDAHRHPHRLPRDQQRPIGVVRRRARTDGLPDFRPDALFAATRCPLTVSYG
jgi:hypothetical protein